MHRIAVTAVLLLTCFFAPLRAESTPAAVQDGVRVYFSPNGGAAEAIIAEVNKAKSTLDVAAYSITHVGIAKSITEAHKRGVKVRVVMDKTQAAGKYSSATFLANHGVPARIDTTVGLMHHKYLIIDSAVLITGSFNLTKGADQSNAENLLVMQGKSQLVEAYETNFNGLIEQSKPYERVN